MFITYNPSPAAPMALVHLEIISWGQVRHQFIYTLFIYPGKAKLRTTM